MKGEIIEDRVVDALNVSRFIRYPKMSGDEKAVFDKLHQHCFDDIGS